MPSRVGHLTKLYDDGTCRARNELTNEEWFGRLIIGSGGMLMFDIIDERNITMGAHIIEPEESKKTGDQQRGYEDTKKERVTVGKPKVRRSPV